jgi:hypothetical protein
MIANSATTQKWKKEEEEREREKNTGIDLSSIL